MAEQLTLELPLVDWIPLPPTERQEGPAWYLCFTIRTDPTDAAQAFEKRFGYHPQEVYPELGLVWVGPVNRLETL